MTDPRPSELGDLDGARDAGAAGYPGDLADVGGAAGPGGVRGADDVALGDTVGLTPALVAPRRELDASGLLDAGYPVGPGPAHGVEPVPAVEPEPAELVTCPECGLATTIALHRRDAAGFCPACDYPLFWAPTRIVLDGEGRAGESLRRLPGTAGRATVASLTCPHCAEQNPLAASVCVRCGRSLVLEPAAPEPEPEPVVVPVAEPEPEPEPRSTTWIWVVAALAVLALVTLVVWLATS
jgi:hypothetical protein